MRDSYGRIRPDFEAWEKLGYKLAEIHENTYVFEDIKNNDVPWFYRTITAEYNDYSKKPEYIKWVEQMSLNPAPDDDKSFEQEFTEEEKAQIEKDIKNWEEETEAELDYQRHIEQAEHDGLYEPTYDPKTGAM